MSQVMTAKQWWLRTFRILFCLIGIIFIFIGVWYQMTCVGFTCPSFSLMDFLKGASPFFFVSIMCFIIFFYLGRIEKSKIDDNDKQTQTDDEYGKKIQSVLLKILLALFCLLILIMYLDTVLVY